MAFQNHELTTVSTPRFQVPASQIGEELHELLTVDDVAALLKVSKAWVYEHIRSRGRSRCEPLPHIKVGKYIRFEPHALRRFIVNKCRAT